MPVSALSIVLLGLYGASALPGMTNLYATSLLMAPPPPQTNPDGGNIQIKASANRVNQGSRHPDEIISQLQEKYGEISYPEFSFEIDTNIVSEDKKGVEVITLKVIIADATFNDDKDSRATNILNVLESFFRNDK